MSTKKASISTKVIFKKYRSSKINAFCKTSATSYQNRFFIMLTPDRFQTYHDYDFLIRYILKQSYPQYIPLFIRISLDGACWK